MERQKPADWAIVAAMATPTLLVQLSDIHIGGDEEGLDPIPRLEAVIDAVRSLPNRPDAVLVSGDLTDNGSVEAFDLPGTVSEPINYSAQVGGLRLIAFDSIVPGQDPGDFPPDQLAWLDRELAAAPEAPTLLALHHTPLTTCIPGWDAINLLAPQLEALGEVVGRHPQLRAIVGGHLHRVAVAALAGCPVLAAPSTYWQVRPDFEKSEEFSAVDVPGFAIHALRDGELSSQVESVRLSP